MHELGITQQIVELAVEHSGGAKVRRIVLEIGKLSMVLPDAVKFCFDACAAGTLAEGAELEIIEIPGRARCVHCDQEALLDRPFGRCLCGETEWRWLSGEELKIKQMEVAPCVPPAVVPTEPGQH
jgi:hydrogenase nickel incorporation protein HypA/HybF